MVDDEAGDCWARVKARFDEAVDLDPAARAEFIRRLEQSDPEIVGDLSALLAAHDRPDAFMASTTVRPEMWTGQEGLASTGRPLSGAFGRYRIVSKLGAGGMGEVYLAHEDALDRDIALKVLPESLASRPAYREGLLREALAAASLNHPNITTIHEIGAVDGRDYISFEYVRGDVLKDRLVGRPFNLAEILNVALPLADALAYAHDRGVVHRDIKPANVMLTDSGVPKLLDFGLATDLRQALDPSDDGPTSMPRIAGTPSAMSPEQVRGESVDRRSDVFSFGSLLYEMATGRPAFVAGDIKRTLEAVTGAEPVPLGNLRPDLPKGLGSIVERCLRKDPAERYQDMTGVAADLRQLAPSSRSARPVVVAAGLIVAAALALGILVWSNRGRRSSTTVPMVTAVADFQSSDDPSDASRIGAMLTRLVRQNLAAAPGLEVLTDQRMADLARTEGTSSTPGTPEQAASLAERAGADVVIVGRYARQDAGVVATAEILRSAESRTLGSVTVRGDGPENVFAMADSLGHQIRAILQEPAMTVDEKRALSDQLTTSVDAYRAYVRGLEGLLRDDTRAAADGFREATILDPAFALAHFRLSMALIWTGEFEEARHSLERALAFREKLTPELQLMLDAIVPYGLHDDTGTALPLLEQVLKRDPSHHDALYMLGEIYTHSAVRSDSAKAAQMYERLLGLDPGLSLVYEHMLSAYLRLGDFDTARQRLAGWNALAAPNLNQLEGTLALWEGRFDQAAANLDDRLIPEFLAGRQDSPSVAAVLAHSASEIADSLKSIGGTYRVLALDLRADILTASGRFRDAADLYRMAVDEPGAIAPEGFHTSIRAGARQRLAFLLELQGDRPAARHEVDAALALQPESYRCLFVSGLLALRDGDLTAAQARLNTLSDLAAKGLSPAAPMYRNTLEAEIVLAGGDAERACTEFDHVLASGRLMEDWYAHEDSIGPFVRDGLARAQLAAGHVEAAEKAWSGLAEGGLERLRQPILWVLSSYERGCLAVEIGQAQQGRELLTEFLDHWGDSDATLSQVIDARKLLAQVVGH